MSVLLILPYWTNKDTDRSKDDLSPFQFSRYNIIRQTGLSCIANIMMFPLFTVGNNLVTL